ncbi:hypothetical protein BHE74_00010290, partial [Ensete ventricosum]
TKMLFAALVKRILLNSIPENKEDISNFVSVAYLVWIFPISVPYLNLYFSKILSLLWDSLTGREHLMFYGRLRNLKGLELQQLQQSLRKHLLPVITYLFTYLYVLQLKTRYGGSYQLTISADPINKDIIEDMITSLCSEAMKIYDVVGTQRFRLPKQVVRVQEIFKVIDVLKKVVAIHAFEVISASIEDVFSNVVNHALESEIA